mmetsp:Transcript_40125/g.93201  ORF Transcript_40125/g.93201 Transcript_40125/m.93201 type:complete len:115 (-) Transcript_40125:90-434(-)
MLCLAALAGHEAAVTSVTADFDAERALSGSDDATLRLWDMGSLECLVVLADWRGPPMCVSANFKALRATTGGADGALSLWDLSGEGRRLAVFESPDNGGLDSGGINAVNIEDGC